MSKPIIPLNDQYRIELDISSWQLSRWIHRNNHPDGGQWQAVSWHRTLQQAGEAAQPHFLCEDKLSGIDDIQAALTASSQLITKAIEKSGCPDSWLAAKQLVHEKAA